MATKRIIEETTGTAASGDYVLTDSSTAGTKKVELVVAIEELTPDASSAAPEMDGTAAAGSSDDFARADHVHPSDTSKVDKVDGKGLSTNDYTTSEKSALAAITAEGGVGTTNLADNSVTAQKLATDAVTTPKLADQSVTDEKLSATGVLAKANRLLGNVLRGTATGAVAQAHGAYAAPPLGMTVYGKSVQDSTPTPSNPVTISSIGDVTITSSGKNLVYKRIEDYVIDSTGKLASLSGYSTAVAQVRAGEQYTFTKSADTGVYGFFTSDPVAGSTTYNSSRVVISGSPTEFTFTAPIDGWVGLRIVKSYTTPQLEIGSQATVYEAPVVEQRLIDLNNLNLRMLPDGTRDTLSVDGSGNVTVTRNVGAVTFDGSSDESWTISSGSRRGYIATSPLCKGTTGTSDVAVGWCDTLQAGTQSNTWDSADPSASKNIGPCFSYDTGGNIQIALGHTVTDASLRDWLSKHPTTIVYPLSTATTESLGQISLRELRSLPDGTCDELVVDADGNVTLTQRVGVHVVDASAWSSAGAVSIGDGWYRSTLSALTNAMSVAGNVSTGYCTDAPFNYDPSEKSQHVATTNQYVLLVAQQSTGAAIAAVYDGATIIYPLANPQTIDLGRLTLPPMPALAAPDATAWATTTPSTTVTLDYERDLTMAITAIESAIADMA